MYAGKLVCAQLMDHLPLHTFRRCVARYPSRHLPLSFSHLDQFLVMACAQDVPGESARYANEKRDWRIRGRHIGKRDSGEWARSATDLDVRGSFLPISGMIETTTRRGPIRWSRIFGFTRSSMESGTCYKTLTRQLT